MKLRTKNTAKPPVVLLYGLDEACQPFEVAATTALVKAAHEALTSQGWRVDVVELSHDLVAPLQPYDPDEWVILNLCEGEPSQDYYYARVAHVLTALGYTFTGSDDHCLDQTQFKWQMKSLLRQHNVPTAEWAVFDTASQAYFDIFPSIVKPASVHCSFGITRDSVAMNVDEVRTQVSKIVAEFQCPALVEEFLDSPEYNVSVCGSDTDDVTVLGISTMTYDAFADIRDRLCTFDAKWNPDSMAYQHIPATCPAPVSDGLKSEIERAAIGAYLASGCRDYGRVDMRLKDGQPMVLDINANCDVSPDSGFAAAAHAAGLTYAEMFGQIIQSAVRRRETAPVTTTTRRFTAEPIGMPIGVTAR